MDKLNYHKDESNLWDRYNIMTFKQLKYLVVTLNHVRRSICNII